MEWIHDRHRANRYELKPFLLKDGKTHPLAIICPGGGYEMICSYVEGLPFARKLNRMGYHAVVVYYQVKELGHYPTPQDDLERAIREILAHKEEWNLDTRCWSLWGSSAGGHLVSSFCTEKRNVPQPGTLVLTYPVITMEDYTHPGSKKWLLGEDASQEDIDAHSVEKNITPDYPPTFVWCGSADSIVPTRNSHELVKALEKNNVKHQFVELRGIDHGVGIGKNLGWFEQAVRFWDDCRKQEK